MDLRPMLRPFNGEGYVVSMEWDDEEGNRHRVVAFSVLARWALNKAWKAACQQHNFEITRTEVGATATWSSDTARHFIAGRNRAAVERATRLLLTVSFQQLLDSFTAATEAHRSVGYLRPPVWTIEIGEPGSRRLLRLALEGQAR
jgi:hypothetical protein